jgi:hypothetical protein
MVGVVDCPKCGGPFWSHVHGGCPAAATPSSSAASSTGAARPAAGASSSPAAAEARQAARDRLVEHAGAVFDAVDALITHRMNEMWSRDRRGRFTLGDLRKRFAGALVDFARELERVRAGRRR